MKVYKRVRKTSAQMGPLEDIYISNDPIWRVFAKDDKETYIFETEDQQEAINFYDKLLETNYYKKPGEK